MIGFLTYIPTVAYSNHLIYIFIIVYLLIKKGKNINFGTLSNFLTILSIVVFATLNNLLHPTNFIEISDYFPFVILILVSYLAALNFTKTDVKIFIYLIAFESLIVILEYYSGVTTFFTSLEGYSSFSSTSLLYYTRPLGLSTNSSVISLKILGALLLINYYKLDNKYILGSKYLMFLGIVFTFNRTTIISLIFFYSLNSIINLFKIKFKIKSFKLILVILAFSLTTIVLIFYLDEISHKIFTQFTRNTGKIELSGRGAIWNEYFKYIEQHFFFGNGSFKYLLKTFRVNKVFHAHNSFIQVIATHGFLIFCIYIWLIIKNLNKNNYLYILTIMIYSLSQYGIFWGVSLLDILFFIFLLKKPSKLNSINKNKTFKNDQ